MTKILMRTLLLSISLFFVIQSYSQLVVTTTQTNIFCYGGSGSATAIPSGGTPAYTFMWNPSGQTTKTAMGLSPGTYTVTVTDAANNTASNTVTISQPAILKVSTSSTPAGCSPNNNGTAFAYVTGGNSPYTYNWNNGQTTQTATALTTGTYSVFVTDATVCTVTQTVTVLPPFPFTITTHNLCFSAAQVSTTGGTAPFTYSWEPSGQTNQTVTGLTTGTNTITVTDAYGCVQTQTVAINPDLTLNTSSTSAQCNVSNGTTTANASGGVPPYYYQWNNTQTTQTVTGLAAGSYSVIVRDSYGCFVSKIVSVVQSSVFGVNLLLKKDTVDSLLWYVYPTITGGTSPYTYSWDFGDGNTSNQSYPSHTYTVVGHYAICLAVTDVNGCNGYTCDSTYKKASLGLVKRIMVVNPTAGIIEENSVSVNSVFPNPAKDILFISLSRVIQGEIRISDIAGKKIYQGKINANSARINVSDFPAGYYNFTIVSETQIIHNKILIVR